MNTNNKLIRWALCALVATFALSSPDAMAQLTDSSYVADVTGTFDQYAHDKNALIGPGMIVVFIGVAVFALVAFGKRFLGSR